MTDNWTRVEGTGWIELKGFGEINPRQDNVAGGRTFFTAMTDQDEYALAHGEHVG